MLAKFAEVFCIGVAASGIPDHIRLCIATSRLWRTDIGE